jgi:hypothetical protein
MKRLPKCTQSAKSEHITQYESKLRMYGQNDTESPSLYLPRITTLTSPLIKTPAVTMASTVPLKAKNRAAMGSSYEPGTVVSKIFSSLTPHSLSALRQPATKFLTCSSFHRVRMIPMRISEPSKSPKDTSLSAAYKRKKKAT